MAAERITLTYRIVMAVAGPIVRWWGRLEVVGERCLPESGPVVLMANHDSLWDPLVIGVAAIRRRQLRALAKASLWHARPVGWVLDRMGQIPIERGRGDTKALATAIEALRRGACIGVFPEGTISRGQALRAQSGAGRLVLAVPGTRLVCVSVTGAVDIVRFPKRPRIRVSFFEPADQPPVDETAIGLSRRAMAQIRALAPYAVPGRRKKAAQLRRRVVVDEDARPRPAQATNPASTTNPEAGTNAAIPAADANPASSTGPTR